MTLATVRLGWRIQRSELFWTAVIAVVLTLGLGLIGLALQSLFASHQPCDADFNGSGCGGLSALAIPWSQYGQFMLGLLWPFPVVVGSILGVAVTAGKLERRTAGMSWTLARSRRRWLLVRLLPSALALFMILGIVAIGAEWLTRSRLVTDQPGFIDYQLRSALFPLRGLLAFVTGAAVGAIIGRTLPALLIAIVFGTATSVSLLNFMDILHTQAATFVPIAAMERYRYDYPLLAASGATIDGPGGGGNMVVPVAEFGYWITVEALVLGVVIIGVGLLASVLVNHRSPS